MTLVERIKKMEAFTCGEPFTTKHVADSTHAPTTQVREALQHMVDSGLLVAQGASFQKHIRRPIHTARLAQPVLDAAKHECWATDGVCPKCGKRRQRRRDCPIVE